MWMKPTGGLWASKENASFGWSQFVKENSHFEVDKQKSFKFVLKNGTRKATIYTDTDLNKLPMQAHKSKGYVDWRCIDFEKCLLLGVDAIELCWYGDEYKDRADGDLYHLLYGWDCDSILILNPKVVEEIH